MPVRKSWKAANELLRFFIIRSILFVYCYHSYHIIRIALDIDEDFVNAVLSDSKNYRVRFYNDMKRMNKLCKDKGLPPIVAMVLDQWPVVGGKAYNVARIARIA